jgi:hypothetical protein
MCRVLVIPRTVYKALADDFPISTRQIMTNLVARAEQVGAAYGGLGGLAEGGWEVDYRSRTLLLNMARHQQHGGGGC